VEIALNEIGVLVCHVFTEKKDKVRRCERHVRSLASQRLAVQRCGRR
jgi:hypothetical protein